MNTQTKHKVEIKICPIDYYLLGYGWLYGKRLQDELGGDADIDVLASCGRITHMTIEVDGETVYDLSRENPVRRWIPWAAPGAKTLAGVVRRAMA